MSISDVLEKIIRITSHGIIKSIAKRSSKGCGMLSLGKKG